MGVKLTPKLGRKIPPKKVPKNWPKIGTILTPKKGPKIDHILGRISGVIRRLKIGGYPDKKCCPDTLFGGPKAKNAFNNQKVGVITTFLIKFCKKFIFFKKKIIFNRFLLLASTFLIDNHLFGLLRGISDQKNFFFAMSVHKMLNLRPTDLILLILRHEWWCFYEKLSKNFENQKTKTSRKSTFSMKGERDHMTY